ncbi:MAG: type I-G CRISPR-associated RAMP protein Csb1/Cas7g [Bryobacteraceae bacterium]
MPQLLSRFDPWVTETGPSALILKEYLDPAAGSGEVVFPPTFAPPEEQRGSPADYVVDGEGENSVCLLDTVGSQANRLEPLFKKTKYRDLVPQLEIKVNSRSVNILDVGHRAADALVRSTELASKLQTAFAEYVKGDATELARAAPTSLVFGAWDSRGSQAKVPRILSSTVRAFRIQRLSRAAQYFSSLSNDEVTELIAKDIQKERKTLSKAGFLDAPAGRTHGGVIVKGDIVRTTILNFTALRALGAPSDDEQMKLRRYILGLGLIAASAPIDLFLRQGCLLVRSDNRAPEGFTVSRDGQRESIEISIDEFEKFAKAAATDFKVGPNEAVDFDPKAAKSLLAKAAKVKEEAL